MSWCESCRKHTLQSDSFISYLKYDLNETEKFRYETCISLTIVLKIKLQIAKFQFSKDLRF